ncbi:MAG: hypothetical protein WC789_09730 [Lentisphaeria bacterium]|jgi:hypothetical protein
MFRRHARLLPLAGCLLAAAAAAPTAPPPPLDPALQAIQEAPTAVRLRPAAPTFFCDLAATAIAAGRLDEARTALTGLVARHFASASLDTPAAAPTGTTLQTLAAAAEARIFLDRYRQAAAGGATLRPETLRWLLRTPQRLALVNDTLSPADNLPEAFRILGELHDLDPQGRDAFFNLILALAVVWDQPPKALHGQYQPLPFQPELPRRYEHFRNLYQRHKAKFNYQRLTPAALVFVVATPVPVEELAWAQQECRWSLASWDKAYTGIRYDQGRLASNSFDWPNGPYTLAAIREHGGICVDQAYFATLSARALGIPAMIFTGEGRRGGHAWFAYLRGEDKWELDIGRYTFDKFAIGHTVNPQTRQPMSNHEVQFLCNRAFNLPAYQLAAAWANLAAILLEAGNEAAAFELAGRITQTAKLNPAGWNLQKWILEKRGDREGLLALCRQKLLAFREFPDLVADARLEEAQLLRTLGRGQEAQALLAKTARALKSDGRGDLAADLGLQEVEALLAKADPASARRRLEQLLKDNQKEGQKALPLIQAYLDLTQRTGQQKEALRFLEPYLNSMFKQAGRGLSVTAGQQRTFLELLLKACENAGATAKARQVQKKLLKG